MCSRIRPFAAHCNLIILQHPNERKKYYSTAKLVTASIQNASLMRGVDFDLAEKINSLPTQPYLLFPGPHARSCDEISLGPDDTIIVADGTWAEAGKIIRHNPALQSLPQLTFVQPLRSRYRIRRQPKAHCLSTIESISYLLQLNAPASRATAKIKDYQSLLDVFEIMVEQQLAFVPAQHRAAIEAHERALLSNQGLKEKAELSVEEKTQRCL